MLAYAVAALVVVLLVLVGALALKREVDADLDDVNTRDFAVEAKLDFFTSAERQFYGHLVEACRPLGLVVFAKVGLKDLVQDRPGSGSRDYNRYSQLHVDFLLVSAAGYRLVAGVELDGPSHQGKKQMARDQKKDAVFQAAGLPLLRFYNHGPDSAEAIRTKLEDGLGVARQDAPA